ncbi:MAG: hypothetical protein IJX30_03315 [Clostridia bacterium]|nr:hypothetical protein [Clostridia bacterium]
MDEREKIQFLAAKGFKQRLKNRAFSKGMSLNSYLIMLLEDAYRREIKKGVE